MPRKKIGGGASAHITLRIPSDLHERLVKAAGSHGTAEEIRRRLEASFAPDPSSKDPKTRELAAAIAGIADEATWYYRPWHEDPYTFEVLREGVGKLLAYYRPKGEAVPVPNPDNIADVLYGPDHSRDVVASSMASTAISKLRSSRS